MRNAQQVKQLKFTIMKAKLFIIMCVMAISIQAKDIKIKLSNIKGFHTEQKQYGGTKQYFIILEDAAGNQKKYELISEAQIKAIVTLYYDGKQSRITIKVK